MNDALNWLLGLEPVEWAQNSEKSIKWDRLPSDGDSIFMILIGALLVVALFWWLYRKEGTKISLRARYTLFSLRVLLAAIVLVMLLEPVLVFSREEKIPSDLIVLVDTSQSMGLTDNWRGDSMAGDIAEAMGIENVEKLGETTRIQLVEKLFDKDRELVEQLGGDGKRNVHVYAFNDRLKGAQLELKDGKPELELGGKNTAIGNAIVQLLNRYEGKNVAGVVVLTEGRNTDPNSKNLDTSAQVAREQNVPIFPIGIGTPVGPSNLQMVSLEARSGNDTLIVNKTNKLTASFKSTGYEESQNTMLVLEKLKSSRSDVEQWEAIQSVPPVPVEVRTGGVIQSVEFDVVPRELGSSAYRVRLLDLDDETDKLDNTAKLQVKIDDGKTRVLFIAGYTFPEVQFIRNALLQDESTEVVTWLQAADDGYRHPRSKVMQLSRVVPENGELDGEDAAPARLLAPSLPPRNIEELSGGYTREKIHQSDAAGNLLYDGNGLPLMKEELVEHPGYDCVVLYDPNPQAWPKANPDKGQKDFSTLLNQYVKERGGGLVYIAGERYTQDMFDANYKGYDYASYISLLPVVRDPELFKSSIKAELMSISKRFPWQLQITEYGMRDPIFQFAKQEWDQNRKPLKTPEQIDRENRKKLSKLPGMMWHLPVSRARPGATVLARHSHRGMTVTVNGKQEQEVLMATQLVGPGRVL